MTKKLKLVVDLDSDEELRTYVKQMIDDQVKSIVRQEFRNCIKEKISETVNKNINEGYILKILDQVTTRLVKDEIKTGESFYDSKHNLRTRADQLIDEKINKLINEEELKIKIQAKAETMVKQIFENIIKR